MNWRLLLLAPLAALADNTSTKPNIPANQSA